MISERTSPNRAPSALEAGAARILLSLGFPASSKGYTYLIRSVIEAYHFPESTEYVTKTLYPKVARLCGCSSPLTVARNCRHAIEYACDNGLLYGFLGQPPLTYPSSAEVISAIAARLREENP